MHTVLRERLREALGQQAPGDRIASERVLAKEFGVSTATVSRALQELEQEGVLRRIPGKGTFLSDEPVARAGEGSGAGLNGEAVFANHDFSPVIPTSPEVQGQVASVAVKRAWIIVQLEEYEFSLNPTSEFFNPRLVSGLDYRITDQGGQAKITLGHKLTEEGCKAAWEEAMAEGVDSIFFIVNERNAMVDVWVEQFAQRHLIEARGQKPPVIIQICVAGAQLSYFDTISFDGEWGAYLATRHLLELGHEKVAFLAPPIKYQWLDQRIRGFHHALRGYGVAVPRGDEEFGVIRTGAAQDGPQMWQQMGRGIAEELLKRDVTGIVAANDQMASALIERLAELGNPVPQSLSIVGYDDWFSSALQGLSTIHPPIDEIADAAVTLATKRLSENGLRDHVQLFLKPTLMARKSTKALLS